MQAYISDPQRVGYKAYLVVYPSSSEAAAKSGFSRLLTKANVKTRLAHLESRVTEKVVELAAVTTEQVLEELAKIGFANMLDYSRVNEDGDPIIDLSELSRNQAAAIQQISIEEFTDGKQPPDKLLEPQAKGGALRRRKGRAVRKTTFKLYDKRAALVDIGRHLGMFVDKVEHSGKVDLVPIINVNGRRTSG
ncbi:phage terminase small subunit [Afipia massiliensis]|uniref:Phage terminase small subunit n=1 Tax=Afipia massiliensis TaxID=211460 RepID=A0A840MXI9_9BRAD|nr:phage terminase small subunit [Afipia massiliensis]